MALTLFFDAMSQPSRTVMMFLSVNNIPHVKKFIDWAKGAHRTDEFIKVNPNMAVPAIKHGNFCLSESTAILRYLHSMFDCPDHWYPKDLEQRAKIDEYLAWHHLNVRINLAMLFREKIFMPMSTGEPANEEKVERFKQNAIKAMNTLENYYLSETKYISSDKISIADLMAITEFSQLEALEPGFLATSSRINTWLQNCKGVLGVHYDKTHEIFGRFKQKIEKKRSKL